MDELAAKSNWLRPRLAMDPAPEKLPEDGASKKDNESTEPKARREKPFELVVSRFVREIDSVASTLPLAMGSITLARQKAREEFQRFLAEHGQKLDEGKVRIDTNHVLGFQKASGNLERASAAAVLVPRSFLVSLVSQYDNFLGLLIETLLLTKPEILNGSEKTLSFSELVEFGSLAAARDHIIEKEVESVLRKSHSEQFDWLENTFKIKLRENLAAWPQFIELTERRNLFVHTGGQVSAQYLKICQQHNVDCKGTKRGDRLRVTPKYFTRSYETVFEIGVKLAHVFWRKLKPDERESADRNLLLISYELLVEEKHRLAIAILDFATETLKNHSSEDLRLRLVVNRAQAYKWSGESERALSILNSEDFSALKEQFQLADAVLRDDFESALKLVKSIGSNGGIRLGDYRQWPLFKEFRKQKDLESAILEIFKEPLNTQISVDPEGCEITREAGPPEPLLFSEQ